MDFCQPLQVADSLLEVTLEGAMARTQNGAAANALRASVRNLKVRDQGPPLCLSAPLSITSFRPPHGVFISVLDLGCLVCGPFFPADNISAKIAVERNSTTGPK